MGNRRTHASLVGAIALVGGFIACGDTPRAAIFLLPDAASGDDSSADDSGNPDFAETSIPEAAPPGDAAIDCPASAKLIYVTGVGAELWSFWPPTFTFKKIGTLNCTTFPTHMTVDRMGVAWVVADGGNLYKTSTKDATCTVSSTWKKQVGYSDFALSLVGLSNSDSTLYVLGQTNLAKFDILTGTFQSINATSFPTFGDMTANGDGSLYFLHDSNPLNLYQVNPANATVVKTYTVGANGGGNQALAYFGGRFYAFENGVVFEYDTKTNTTKSLGNAPLQVTGAGQSTCVPTVPQEAGPPN